MSPLNSLRVTCNRAADAETVFRRTWENTTCRTTRRHPRHAVWVGR